VESKTVLSTQLYSWQLYTVTASVCVLCGAGFVRTQRTYLDLPLSAYRPSEPHTHALHLPVREDICSCILSNSIVNPSGAKCSTSLKCQERSFWVFYNAGKSFGDRGYLSLLYLKPNRRMSTTTRQPCMVTSHTGACKIDYQFTINDW